MARPLSIVSALALVGLLSGGIVLARIDRGGPPHADVWLEGGVPATLYLPGDGPGGHAFFETPREGERPAAVVLMHGFAGDRLSMSGFARRLAGAGYAVLNIDAMGHGQNRNPYRRSSYQAGSFAPDLAAAADFLRLHPAVDGSRIAVAGHSMGAGAALDYATRDSGIDAAVLISGGSRLEGPFTPSNALFLYAAGDPERTRKRSQLLAARIAGLQSVEPGRTYGNLEHRDAVRLVEIGGADHQTIVWKQAAVAETVAWLDATFGVERGGAALPSDPRAAWLIPLGLAFLLVLPGVGLLAGRLAPQRPWPGAEGRWVGLGVLAGAFVLIMPLLAPGTPARLVPLEVGDAIASLFALAGLVLLAGIQLRRPELLRGSFAQPLATSWAAGLALVAVFVLLQPFGMVIHRVTLTPERSLAWLLVTLAFLPLSLAINLLLRRGPVAGASLAVVCGRLVTLLVLALGITVGVVPRVTAFMLPALTGMALVFEALATPLYASSRNILAIAIVDAGWLALVTASIMPIRI